MSELRKIFIENLKYYRKQKGMRQLDLALEIGKSSNYINSIENGKYFPSPETIEQIASCMEISPALLFSETRQDQTDKQIDFSKIEDELKSKVLKDISVAFSKIGEN